MTSSALNARQHKAQRRDRCRLEMTLLGAGGVTVQCGTPTGGFNGAKKPLQNFGVKEVLSDEPGLRMSPSSLHDIIISERLEALTRSPGATGPALSTDASACT